MTSAASQNSSDNSTLQKSVPDPEAHSALLEARVDDPLVLPTVSALICTRNRGASLVPTVRSILHPESACSELVIIDQSPGNETEEAVAPFRGDSRLRYVHSATRGKCIALNLGIQACSGEIIAITDDDCEVGSDWPHAHQEIFARYPKVGVTYGNVIAVAHDETQGFIPVYDVPLDRICTTIHDKITARGIGANMAVRRSTMLEIGGFDEELGVGARFTSCEEGDISLRCLLKGYHVYETGASTISHFGFRTWEQGRALMRDSFFGIGAAFVKPIRCGHREAAQILFWELWSHALLPSLRATVTFKRNLGWGKTVSFMRGVARGWRTPIDCARLVYLPESASARVNNQPQTLPPQ